MQFLYMVMFDSLRTYYIVVQDIDNIAFLKQLNGQPENGKKQETDGREDDAITMNYAALWTTR